ncbi:protein of unknown function [Blastococcus saxobsidens DD2]|uniref:Uncharacterized protein n=1 Tax=Blastococcus saxobsidens (strain DD2) TaxID=1146883 RepID=H6RTI6_BLASD|nr:protein of unknown function [Blastococcus saxobsidens DD2]
MVATAIAVGSVTSDVFVVLLAHPSRPLMPQCARCLARGSHAGRRSTTHPSDLLSP